MMRSKLLQRRSQMSNRRMTVLRIKRRLWLSNLKRRRKTRKTRRRRKSLLLRRTQSKNLMKMKMSNSNSSKEERGIKTKMMKMAGSNLVPPKKLSKSQLKRANLRPLRRHQVSNSKRVKSFRPSTSVNSLACLTKSKSKK